MIGEYRKRASPAGIDKPSLHIAGAVLSSATSALFFILAPILYMQAASSYPQLGFNSMSVWTQSAILLGSIFMFLNAGAVLLGNERIAGVILRAASQVAIAYYVISVVGHPFTITVQGNYHLSMAIYYIALILASFALLRIIPSFVEYLEYRRYVRGASVV